MRIRPQDQSVVDRAAWVVLLAVGATASVPPVAGVAQGVRVLAGGTVVDGTGGEPVTDGVVVIRDDRIECAGTRAECAVPAGAEMFDVTGKWLIPGLVDAHMHYSQTGWADGRPDAYDARERFPYDATIARLKDPSPFWKSYLCSGVTATFDVGGFPWTWGIRDEAERSPHAPHVAAAGPLLSTRDHWLNLPGERQFHFIDSDEAVDAGAHYVAANGSDAIKVWFLVRETSPDAEEWKARLMRAGERARELNVPLIVHATSLWGAKQAVAAGAQLLVHSVSDRDVDEQFLVAAKEAGTVYTPTLVVTDGYRQLRARAFESVAYDLACVDPATRSRAFLTDSLPDRPDETTIAQARERAARELALTSANLMRVHRAGIPVVVGTDAGNPLTLHGPSIFLEMEAMQRAGMTPMDVLVAATRNGAIAMGRGADFGVLEARRIADLVVVGADPTTDIAHTRRIELVVRGGAIHRRPDLEFRD
jgi:imidazolonepropionase-like amidohydrolase